MDLACASGWEGKIKMPEHPAFPALTPRTPKLLLVCSVRQPSLVQRLIDTFLVDPDVFCGKTVFPCRVGRTEYLSG
jgi:hypothetical protein